MPRKPRPSHAGIYHVAARAPQGELLFRDTGDFIRFEGEVRKIVSDQCICVAACALDMHYHLLLDIADGMLARRMHLLNSRYAAGFKARYGRRGHTFGERYMSVHVDNEEQLMTEFRYVVRNPVEAGLCESPADWLWSSYRSAIGLDSGRFAFADPSSVLACFDGSVEQLRRFVETQWPSDRTAGARPRIAGPGPEEISPEALSAGARRASSAA